MNHTPVYVGDQTRAPNESQEFVQLSSLSQEYMQAVGTNSFNEFWQRIKSLIFVAVKDDAESSSASGELENFNIIAKSLLDPDAQVLDGLANSKGRDLYYLVSDYFENGNSSSELCGGLLKRVQTSRSLHTNLQTALERLLVVEEAISQSPFDSFKRLVEAEMLFAQEESCDKIRDHYVDLEQKLASMKEILKRKLRNLDRCGKVANFVLLPLWIVVLIFMFFAALIVFPLVLKYPQEFKSRFQSLRKWFDYVTKQRRDKLISQISHLDDTEWGTCIAKNNLETIKPLIIRLQNEIISVRKSIAFFELSLEYNLVLQKSLEQLQSRQHDFRKRTNDLEFHVMHFFFLLTKTRSTIMQKMSYF